MFSDMAALRITKDVGEVQLGVAVVGFDQDDIGMRIGAFVVLHSQFQAGMDHRAKGLAQHGRQAAIDYFRNPAPLQRHTTLHDPGYQWHGGVKGHQRIQAQHQVDPLVQCHRRMQRLLQGAVHIILVIDFHWREQAGQGRTGLYCLGDGNMVPPRAAKRRRFAGIKIGCNQRQPGTQLPEIIGEAVLRK